jgi:hypothetical protein
MSETTGAPDEQRDGISRRTLIKRAAATGAVAWAAPTILHMSAAGAQTQTCYAFKLQAGAAGACTCTPLSGGIDPACGIGPGPGTPDACPPPGVIVSATGCSESTTATITLRQGCLFTFVGYKAGNSCFTCPTGCTGGVGTNSVTIGPTAMNLSHVILGVCCTS